MKGTYHYLLLISRKLRRLNPHRVHVQYKKILFVAHNLHMNSGQYNDIHNRNQSQSFFMGLVFFYFSRRPCHYFHLFQWGTQLELAFSNTSPSWCTASTEHKANWFPRFCMSPQKSPQCIDQEQERFGLVGLSKSSLRQFQLTGLNCQLLLKDIDAPDLKNPGAKKPVAEPRPDSTWRSCETWFELSGSAFLRPQGFCSLQVSTLHFLTEQSPLLQANLWST